MQTDQLTSARSYITIRMRLRFAADLGRLGGADRAHPGWSFSVTMRWRGPSRHKLQFVPSFLRNPPEDDPGDLLAQTTPAARTTPVEGNSLNTRAEKDTWTPEVDTQRGDQITRLTTLSMTSRGFHFCHPFRLGLERGSRQWSSPIQQLAAIDLVNPLTW
jgi:hypothetical protein